MSVIGADATVVIFGNFGEVGMNASTKIWLNMFSEVGLVALHLGAKNNSSFPWNWSQLVGKSLFQCVIQKTEICTCVTEVAGVGYE